MGTGEKDFLAGAQFPSLQYAPGISPTPVTKFATTGGAIAWISRHSKEPPTVLTRASGLRRFDEGLFVGRGNQGASVGPAHG